MLLFCVVKFFDMFRISLTFRSRRRARFRVCSMLIYMLCDYKIIDLFLEYCFYCLLIFCYMFWLCFCDCLFWIYRCRAFASSLSVLIFFSRAFLMNFLIFWLFCLVFLCVWIMILGVFLCVCMICMLFMCVYRWWWCCLGVVLVLWLLVLSRCWCVFLWCLGVLRCIWWFVCIGLELI